MLYRPGSSHQSAPYGIYDPPGEPGCFSYSLVSSAYSVDRYSWYPPQVVWHWSFPRRQPERQSGILVQVLWWMQLLPLEVDTSLLWALISLPMMAQSLLSS